MSTFGCCRLISNFFCCLHQTFESSLSACLCLRLVLPYLERLPCLLFPACQQLLFGFGWRITGVSSEASSKLNGTRSVVLATDDPSGIKFVLTAPTTSASTEGAPSPEKKARSEAAAAEEGNGDGHRHFALGDHNRFTECHSGAQVTDERGGTKVCIAERGLSHGSHARQNRRCHTHRRDDSCRSHRFSFS
jgi:hypothetical protein